MRFLCAAIIIFFSIVSLSAQENDFSIEKMTPSGIALFVKTSKISRLVSSVNRLLRLYPNKEKKKKLYGNLNEMKSLTGINFLDRTSLKAAGIDIERPAGLAYSRNVKSGTKRRGDINLIIFIPVRDEKKFPLKFVELIKKASGKDPDADIYPAITMYKNARIYQMRKDMFFSTAGGYFILTGEGAALKKTIDLFLGDAGSLYSDRAYSSLIKERSASFDINIFARNSVLKELAKSQRKKRENRMRRRMEMSGENEDNPFIKSVEYMIAGAGLDSNKLKLRFASNFNMKHPPVSMILKTIQPGLWGKAIYPKGISLYSFISYDPVYLSKICSGNPPFCSFYNSIKVRLMQEFGVDYRAHVLSNFRGAINVLLERFGKKGKTDRYAIFFPMKDARKTAGLLARIKTNLKRRYGKDRRFGELRAGRQKAFWYMDDSRSRIYFAADKRGLYMSGNLRLLKRTLGSREAAKGGNSIVAVNNTDKDLFFVLYLKENGFLKNMAKMQARGAPDVKNVLGRTGDILIRGAKKGNFVSFDIDVKIK